MENKLDEYLDHIISEFQKTNSKEFKNLKKNIHSLEINEENKEKEMRLVIASLVSLAIDAKDGTYKNVESYLKVLNHYKIPRKKINYNRITYLFEVKYGNDVYRIIEIKSNYTLLDLGVACLLSLYLLETSDFCLIYEGNKYTSSPFDDSGYLLHREFMNEMNLSVNDEMNLLYEGLNIKIKLIDVIEHNKTITWKVPRVIKGEGNSFEDTEGITGYLDNNVFKVKQKHDEFILSKCNSKIRNLYSLFIEIYTDNSERMEFEG